MVFLCENNLNVEYKPQFLDFPTTNEIFFKLRELKYFSPEYFIFGRKVKPFRKICAYADSGISYSYSGQRIYGKPWIPVIQQLKEKAENYTGAVYNFALLNFYPDGSSQISHHKDDEACLDIETPISTFSFGASRTLQFRRTDFPDVNIQLEPGSLVILRKPTNELFTHAVLPEKDVYECRISISFRNVLQEAPPSKKRKTLTIPNGDWLEKMYIDIMPPSSFELTKEALITIKEYYGKFFLDIRRYTLQNHLQIPTKQGVCLSSKDWFYFQQKMDNFNSIYPDCSSISGDNLIILNKEGKVHLQKIDVACENALILKPNFVLLYEYEVLTLKEKLPVLTKCAIEALWNDFFPRYFQRNFKLEGELSQQEPHEAFISILEELFNEQLKSLFKCQGCLVDSYSQLNHDCLYVSQKEKFERIGETIWLTIDYHELCKKMLKLNIFESHFFRDFDLDKWKTMLYTKDV